MKKLTSGNEGKIILQFALPMLLGNVFQQFYNVVDSIVVGQYLGKEALSAVGAAFPLIFVLVSLVIGFSSGATIIISQYFGAGKLEQVKKASDTMFIVLFFSSFIVTFLGIILCESIFRLTDLPEHLIPLAKTYFVIIMCGNLPLFCYNAISSVLRGLGDSRTPLYFLILSTLLNVGLDLLFVLAFKWGISGVAFATIISQSIAFIIAIIYINSKHKVIRISFKKLNFDSVILKTSLKIGLPSGFQHMFVSIGMVVLYSIVNKFGTNVIAAFSVAGRLDSFALMPAMNFSMALTAFTGQNIGAKQLDRVKRGLIATLKMTIIVSIVFTLLAIFLGKYLMAIFTSDLDVINIGYSYLVIVSIFYIVFSIMFSINSVFQGAGDTIIPMINTLLALWLVRIPFAYFFSMDIKFISLFHWESTPDNYIGIWWGIPLGWLCGMTFAIIYYTTGRWKKKQISTDTKIS